jgi:2-oxoglutarate ferredoxin oxidoreductase subunit delta
MPRITINYDKCKGCLLCISFCPKNLIVKSDKLNRQGLNYVEFRQKDSCLGCAMCAIICPDCCIEVYK